jgi:hypothetical protein
MINANVNQSRSYRRLKIEAQKSKKYRTEKPPRRSQLPLSDPDQEQADIM